MIDPSDLDFAKGNGLVTVVAQDATTGMVLMVAHADRDAVERTLATGEMHYYSRRRGLWHKGATSGNRQRIVSLVRDCDGDALLAHVIPAGPACHTGADSCFSGAESADILSALDATIAARVARMEDDKNVPAGANPPSYTIQLLQDRNLRLKKIGEEAAELIAASADGDRNRAVEETADLFYHALVALHAAGGSLADVRRALARRAVGERATR